jgi:hypothetical protein
VRIDIEAGADDAELEVWAAERRVDLLSKLLERPVVFQTRTPAMTRPARAKAGSGR